MSQLNLTKPLLFFDIESTGLNIVKDRIIELAALKINPNKTRESKMWLINPEKKINPEAQKIHGISDADVAECPTFKHFAKEIKAFFSGCDLAGYNFFKFDIPMLAEEFLRVDIDFNFSSCKLVDVQNIFHKKEQRTLVAAYQFYCKKDLTNAHSAQADTLATYEVLEGQIAKYDDLDNDISFLHDFSQPKFKPADFNGFIVYDDQGELLFNFGKYKGNKVMDILKKDVGYFGWILNADFPQYTKKILTKIKLGQKL